LPHWQKAVLEKSGFFYKFADWQWVSALFKPQLLPVNRKNWNSKHV